MSDTTTNSAEIPHEYLYPSDDMIDRNRIGRVLVFVTLEIVQFIFVMWLATAVFSALGWPLVGIVVGFALSAYVGLTLFEKSIVQNDDEQCFITVNNLQTLTGGKRDFDDLPPEEQMKRAREYGRVAYGPGAHFAYPWESRDESNNVSLAEASESFDFKLQCKDGTRFGEGASVQRPNLRRDGGFTLGAAAIASNLADLVRAEAVTVLGDKTVEESTAFLPQLNARLANKFGDLTTDRTSFEKRFEVFLGDITVGELLGSPEVQTTLNAVAEGAIIRTAIAKYLGYKDMKGVRAAITRGTLTKDELRRAEERMLQISGQDDVKTTRNLYELDVSGLDPETAEALKGLVAAAAPIAQAVSGRRGSGGAKSGGRNRKGGDDK